MPRYEYECQMGHRKEFVHPMGETVTGGCREIVSQNGTKKRCGKPLTRYFGDQSVSVQGTTKGRYNQ